MSEMPEEHPAAGPAGSVSTARYERDETRAHQLDRNWNELLQEIRVLQTGSQILAAFLIVLPFQQRFGQLDRFQVGLYLGLLVLALLIVSLLLTPVSMHRTLFRRLVKDEMVEVADRLLKVALAMLGLLLAGVAVLIFDVVAGRVAGAVAGSVLLVVVMRMLFVYPRVVWRRG